MLRKGQGRPSQSHGASQSSGATTDGTQAGTDGEQVSLKAKGQKAKVLGDLERMTLEERERGLMGNHNLETGWASTTWHDLRQVTQPPGAPVSPSEMMMRKITLPQAPGRNNNEVLCWRNHRDTRQQRSVTLSKCSTGQHQGKVICCLRPWLPPASPHPRTWEKHLKFLADFHKSRQKWMSDRLLFVS